jgi:hypothetical protein
MNSPSGAKRTRRQIQLNESQKGEKLSAGHFGVQFPALFTAFNSKPHMLLASQQFLRAQLQLHLLHF